MDFREIGNEYIKNPKAYVAKLKESAIRTNSPILYSLLGTHYITVEPDEVQAEEYLIRSIEAGGNPMGIYNLAYLYETKVRRGEKNRESSMIELYELAIKNNVLQAYNQLGRYLMENPTIQSPHMPEDLFKHAASKGILPAKRNLATLYKDNYTKRIKIRQELWAETKTTEDLMNCMLDMLNSGDYHGYCRWMRDSGLSKSFDISALLKNTPSIDMAECCICFVEGKCVKLACTHTCCCKCLFEVYIGPSLVCPMCRKEL